MLLQLLLDPRRTAATSSRSRADYLHGGPARLAIEKYARSGSRRTGWMRAPSGHTQESRCKRSTRAHESRASCTASATAQDGAETACSNWQTSIPESRLQPRARAPRLQTDGAVAWRLRRESRAPQFRVDGHPNVRAAVSSHSPRKSTTRD